MAKDRFQVDLDRFDREYRLSELLPEETCKALLSDDLRATGVAFHILHVNGAPHFSTAPLPPEWARLVCESPGPSPDRQPMFEKNRSGSSRALMYEGEIRGLLVILSAHGPGLSLDILSDFLGAAIEQVMVTNAKMLMTSGLHCQVVEETYLELAERAMRLEESEGRYRRLSENLEKEVEKKTEDIRRATAKILQQENMAAVGHLAAGVAHEINNPMGFIASNLHTLSDYQTSLQALIADYRKLWTRLSKPSGQSAGRETVTPLLRRIRDREADIDVDFLMEDMPELITESLDGAKRIQSIVSDLSDYARPGETHPVSVNVNRCLDSAVNILGSLLRENITLKKAYADIPNVRAFPQQIGQVFVNLIRNAVQAIDGAGEIELSSGRIDDTVWVEIGDTGEGIAEAQLPRIFDPFYTTRPVGSGTGMGLNVVYRIMENHGGSVEVNSKEGRGTRIRVYLPIRPESMESMDAHGVNPAVETHPATAEVGAR